MRPIAKTALCAALTAFCSGSYGQESSLACPDPTYPGDASYAPSAVAVRVSQDGLSRYIRARVKWHQSDYIAYWAEKSINQNGSLFPMGFEMETHFYNYNDAFAIGGGPAYILDMECNTNNLSAGAVCGSARARWSECELPSCYFDTQALSGKNSLNEYAQPNIQIGSFNGRLLQAGRAYAYGTRATTGRGDASWMAVKMQLTRPSSGPLLGNIWNQYPCAATSALPNPVELAPMQMHIKAPACFTRIYEYAGEGYYFCTP